jgi:pimeloyl-ACP methyl ester carboxylesterase
MSATKTIVFSHANGFPAGCYRVIFDIWEKAGWTVHALPQFGHDPAYPVTSNWRHLRDQLLHFVDKEVKPTGKIMFAGHSLGGILSLLAVCKRPDLAAGLLMLDSPVVGGWKAHSIQVMKMTRLMHRVSPGKISSQRRYEWPNREAVLTHFQAKHKFARWDPRVLQDYVDSGFEEREGKTRLRFLREVETRIYDTLPHHLDALLKRHPPQCPVGFVAGTQSEELRRAGAAASKALARKHFTWMEGTHLYPFERPDDTAAVGLQMLEAFRVESGLVPAASL